MILRDAFRVSRLRPMQHQPHKYLGLSVLLLYYNHLNRRRFGVIALYKLLLSRRKVLTYKRRDQVLPAVVSDDINRWFLSGCICSLAPRG